MRVLVTGGAGFVGGSVAIALSRRRPDWAVVALDNLHRRGSELNLPRLAEAGVEFRHGDVRDPADLGAVPEPHVIVECSAEPSALVGAEGGLDYVFGTNLVGARNCLELARRHSSFLVFLSTSRVYPVAALSRLMLEESETRFELAGSQPLPGVSRAGIAEDFPLEGGARTFYGTSKLAAELLIAEYRESFGLRAVIDRCGVIAGPWQMGRIDQGVFAYWLLAHYFGRPLEYLGFGGTGKQVRDLLHVDDLVDLLDEQLREPERWQGAVFNVGGGRERSLSLLELTELCRELSGREVEIRSSPETRPGDVPIYVSDCSALFAHTAWRPQRTSRQILEDISRWAAEHGAALPHALG
jgi:CDP-paratose 2-epimerase